MQSKLKGNAVHRCLKKSNNVCPVMHIIIVPMKSQYSLPLILKQSYGRILCTSVTLTDLQKRGEEYIAKVRDPVETPLMHSEQPSAVTVAPAETATLISNIFTISKPYGSPSEWQSKRWLFMSTWWKCCEKSHGNKYLSIIIGQFPWNASFSLLKIFVYAQGSHSGSTHYWTGITVSSVIGPKKYKNNTMVILIIAMNTFSMFCMMRASMCFIFIWSRSAKELERRESVSWTADRLSASS